MLNLMNPQMQYLMQQTMPQQPAPGPVSQFLDSPGMAMAGAAINNMAAMRRGQAPQHNPMQVAAEQQRRNSMLQQQRMEMLQRNQASIERQRLLQLQSQTKRPTLKDAEGYQRYVDTGERVFPGAEKTGETFQGGGMEAGMFNIVADPEISWDDPDKQAAAAFLSRPRSVVTPQGPMTIPGADLSMYGYQPAGPAGGQGDVYGLQKKDLTQSQVDSRGFFQTALAAHEKLLPLENSGMAIAPEVIDAYLSYRDSPMGSLLNRMMSADQRRYLQLILDSGMVKLRDESGAALGKEEIATQLRQLIIASNDSDEQKRDKQQRREQAIDKFYSGAGRFDDAEREEYRLIKESWAKPKLPGGGTENSPSSPQVYDSDNPHTWHMRGKDNVAQ